MLADLLDSVVTTTVLDEWFRGSVAFHRQWEETADIVHIVMMGNFHFPESRMCSAEFHHGWELLTIEEATRRREEILRDQREVILSASIQSGANLVECPLYDRLVAEQVNGAKCVNAGHVAVHEAEQFISAGFGVWCCHLVAHKDKIWSERYRTSIHSFAVDPLLGDRDGDIAPLRRTVSIPNWEERSRMAFLDSFCDPHWPWGCGRRFRNAALGAATRSHLEVLP